MEERNLKVKGEKCLSLLKQHTLYLFHSIRNDLVHLKKIANDFEKCLIDIKKSIETYEEIVNHLKEIESKEVYDENEKTNFEWDNKK